MNERTDSAVAGTPSFSPEFVWGVATSAYQIEGAEGGRGTSMWDVFAKRPSAVRDGSSGEVACDHYRRYREDVALVASIGFDAYRFSISWSRVQPQGRGSWNSDGWDFYERLLDELERKRIAPWVTLYHWDLPQPLEEAGGWRSRETALRFAEYAAEFARRFGSRVGSVATHNEPLCTATFGHETGEHAPGWKDRRAAMQVSHHLLVSHGLAVRALRGEGYRGQLGIVLNQWPVYPADQNSEPDRVAARMRDGLWNRWYLDPLLLGSYPNDVLSALGADAPQIGAGDLELIHQPLDFLGVNYYNRIWCSTATPPIPPPNALGTTDMGWEIFPEGLTEHLIRLARAYNPPPIFVTENGVATADVLEGERVRDEQRIRYFDAHIDAVARARRQGVDVRGYFAWSLLDNFEWSEGYTKRFGLVYVDYATQRRVSKESAQWFQAFLAAHRAGHQGSGGR